MCFGFAIDGIIACVVCVVLVVIIVIIVILVTLVMFVIIANSLYFIQIRIVLALVRDFILHVII